MRSILFGTVAAIAVGAAPAAAADLGRVPVKAPVMAPVAVYNWTGFYIGGNVGYSWGRGSGDLAGTATTTTRTRVFRTAGPTLISDDTVVGAAVPFIGTGSANNIDGIIGGGQIGYNWQSGPVLFGLEADFQGSGERGSSTFCQTLACPVGSLTGSVDHKLRWFGTVRGRAGWLPTDRVLLYVTGGLAYGQIDSDYSLGFLGAPLTGFSTKNTKAGYTIGGGIEGALWGNWTAKAEYLFMDLGNFGSGTGAATTTASVNLLNTPQQGFNTVIDTSTTASGAFSNRFRDHIFRVGINYRFGPEPVVARY